MSNNVRQVIDTGADASQTALEPVAAYQPVKRCTKCGVEKLLSDFGKNARRKDGMQTWCRICNNALSRAWSAANLDRKRESSRAWVAANHERNRETTRAWAAANPERMRVLVRAWAIANPDKRNAAWHRYNALKLGAFVENVSIKTLMERDCLVCGICELQIPTEHENRLYRASIDHIIPLSKRGEHSYANTQPAHLICNIRKGAKLLNCYE